MRAINPHLDWPREQMVSTHIDVSHEAATPAGFEVAGHKLVFGVEADDGMDTIARGWHERLAIDKVKFDAKMILKRGLAGS